MTGAHPDEWKLFAEYEGRLETFFIQGKPHIRAFGIVNGMRVGKALELVEGSQRGEIERAIALLIHGFYLSVKFPNGKPE